jgi:hypothetical protein
MSGTTEPELGAYSCDGAARYLSHFPCKRTQISLLSNRLSLVINKPTDALAVVQTKTLATLVFLGQLMLES